MRLHMKYAFYFLPSRNGDCLRYEVLHPRVWVRVCGMRACAWVRVCGSVWVCAKASLFTILAQGMDDGFLRYEVLPHRATWAHEEVDSNAEVNNISERRNAHTIHTRTQNTCQQVDAHVHARTRTNTNKHAHKHPWAHTHVICELRNQGCYRQYRPPTHMQQA